MKTKRELRTVEISNGSYPHTIAVYQQISDDTYWIQDRTYDPYGTCLEQIQDGSDMAISDAVSQGGFEILQEQASEDEKIPSTFETRGQAQLDKLRAECYETHRRQHAEMLARETETHEDWLDEDIDIS